MGAAPPLLAPAEPPVAWPLVTSLQAAVTELAGASDTSDVARVIAQAGVSGLGVHAAVVSVRSADGRRLEAVHARGLSAAAREGVAVVAADADGFIAGVGRSREPRYLPSGAEATAFGRHDPPAAGALAGLPIRRDGRGFGVVVFGWRHRRAFSAGDRGFLVALGELCALAMDRLRLAAERDRLRGLLGRVHAEGSPATPHLDVGDMHLDLIGHRVVIGDRTIGLTPTELALLVYLAEQPGRARNRREILRHLWRSEHVGDGRVCDAHISNLRHKIELDPAHPRRIVTRRGIGYALQVL